MPPIRDYLAKLKQFQSNARLYLLYSFASGFAMGILRLLFNFYVLSLGYDRGFLGTLVAIPPLVITFLAIPAGMLSHRFGLRFTLIAGASLMVVSVFGMSFSSAAVALVLFAVGRGLGRTLLSVSNAPFMTDNSGVAERTHLFSVQFATRLTAMFIGSSLAGALPTIVASIGGFGAEDPAAYRGSLWVCAFVLILAIVPLLRLPRLQQDARPQARPRFREMFRNPKQLFRLFLPQVVIGFGAGVLVPFLNVYFKTQFGLSDITLGFLFAFQSVFMALATLVGPIVAERLRRVRAVVFVQLLSIPFLRVLRPREPDEHGESAVHRLRNGVGRAGSSPDRERADADELARDPKLRVLRERVHPRGAWVLGPLPDHDRLLPPGVALDLHLLRPEPRGGGGSR